MEKDTSEPTNDAHVVAGSIDSTHGGGLWSRIKNHATLEVEESSYAPPGTSWSNKDLDPVPPEQQTWHTYNFVTYWISDAFSISNWRIGASLIAIGLSWKLALVAVVIGNFVTALVVTYNGIIGARLHIPFTVQARSAFGFYFSYVIIIFRVVVSIFWYGIGTYTGAECVRSIIYAWAPDFRNIPNQLPESANIDTGFMISHQLHWFFTFKAVITPIAGFAILGWVVHSTGGGSQVFTYGNSYSGSSLGWAFMSGVNAMIGNFATLGVNMNDFSRYSMKPNSPYVQLVIIPIAFIVMMLFGIIGANGTRLMYGEVLWDPMLIIDNWTSPGGRAAAFFIALAFLIASIGINISANSISVAVDLSTLFPRHLNIRRAQYVCAILGGWAMCPWEILASAESLLTFMDGYSIWLAPIAGILISDYWIVNNQRANVIQMYQPHGMYAYEKWGTNWRSVIAFMVGFAPLLPGFAKAVTSSIDVSAGSSNLYALGYFYAFLSSSALYIALSKIWPPKSQYTGRTIAEHLAEEPSHV
ncbi:putative Allantoin permease [Seiridium cardinale]|uniref:Allantoin permease n=1 Tax=Seiridium cardinale TaxID=138064 RepID=A0ABR2XJ72_9PEZI